MPRKTASMITYVYHNLSETMLLEMDSSEKLLPKPMVALFTGA